MAAAYGGVLPRNFRGQLRVGSGLEPRSETLRRPVKQGGLPLWRSASAVSKAFAGVGFGAAGILVILTPFTRPAFAGLAWAAVLAGFSIALLLAAQPSRRRPPRGTHSPHPPSEANAAVLPVPQEPVEDAEGREEVGLVGRVPMSER